MTTLLLDAEEIITDPQDCFGPTRQCKRCNAWFQAYRSNNIYCEKCDAPDMRRRKGDRHKNRHNITRLIDPFLAIDGEGGGANENGQQNYLLMCAREAADDAGTTRVLFKNNKRLTTKDCLEFILSLPQRKIIVGFFF